MRLDNSLFKLVGLEALVSRARAEHAERAGPMAGKQIDEALCEADRHGSQAGNEPEAQVETRFRRVHFGRGVSSTLAN